MPAAILRTWGKLCGIFQSVHPRSDMRPNNLTYAETISKSSRCHVGVVNLMTGGDWGDSIFDEFKRLRTVQCKVVNSNDMMFESPG